MTLREKLFANEESDRAVSPVIGVILMVAITVILAAVIGTFVLDLSNSAGNSAPSASLSVDPVTSGTTIEVSHEGGDGLDASQTRVNIVNESGTGDMTWEPGSSDTFSVGETITFDLASTGGSPTGWSLSGSTGTAAVDVNSGNQYTIQFIDTESQRVIFETTITA